jgi:membrane protease YdiL (CAAX protease family)
MKQIALFVKRQTLPLFCALTIALSFVVTQLPLAGETVPVVMVLIPVLIALSLTAATDGWKGARTLIGKLGQWRLRPIWVVAALALGLALRLIMSGVALLLGLIPAIQLRAWSPAQLAFFAVMLFAFAIPEELGWRGYALPKLLKAHSPLVAGLIVGVLWGSLHLALTLPGMINAGAPLLPTLLGLIGLSVLATWLYISTNGNLLLTSLFHAAQSFFVIANDGITLGQQTWLMAGVYLAAAVVVALAARPRFVRKPDQAIDATLVTHGSALSRFKS